MHGVELFRISGDGGSGNAVNFFSLRHRNFILRIDILSFVVFACVSV